MKVIGNRSYPETVEGALAKPALAKMLRAEIKRRYSDHHLAFLEAKIDPESMYNTFLDQDAADAINIPNDIIQDARRLAGQWDDKEWVSVINEARKHISQLLERDALHAVYLSREFKAYHAAQGGRERRVDDPGSDERPEPKLPAFVRAANRLGIDKPEELRVYIAALEKYDALKVRPIAQKILRKHGVKLSVENFNEFLFYRNFAKRPTGVQPEELGQHTPQIRLNRKALGVCGFENMRSDKALARIRAFILAMEKKDKRAAEVAFAKIMKEEPPTSRLNGAKLIDLFKAVKKRKAFELQQ